MKQKEKKKMLYSIIRYSLQIIYRVIDTDDDDDDDVVIDADEERILEGYAKKCRGRR